MSKLPGYDSHDTLVINHAQLRAPVDMQAECQQQLLSIEGLSQDTGEYLFLRQLKVNSSAAKLGTDIRKKLIQQSDLAVEGGSIDAENAQAVRFKSLGQLLAQLSQHIQMGRKDLWYWQSWQHLFQLPVGDALALLWSEYATDLADLVQALSERGQLQRFWLSLSKEQGNVILKSVKRALGVGAGNSQQTIELSTVKDKINISVNALSPWRGLEACFDYHDERLQLASLITLLRWRPDYLFQKNSQQNIESISKQLSGQYSLKVTALQENNKVEVDNKNTKLNETNHHKKNSIDKEVSYSERQDDEGGRKTLAESKGLKQREIIKESDDKKFKARPIPGANKYHYTAEQLLLDSVRKDRLSEIDHSVLFKTDDIENKNLTADLLDSSRSDEDMDQLNGIILTDKVSEMEGIEYNSQQIYADRGAPFCQQGGVFYLLNFMARKNTQSLLQQHQAYETLKGPWGCLYRLADLLNRKEDAALDQFFSYRMGLDSVEELKQLPPLSHAEQYQQYAEKLYGSLVWNSNLLSIPAQIEYTSSHLDIHYPMHRVDLEVRRVALDINPGWLPWLGQVVNFHYHADLTTDGV